MFINDKLTRLQCPPNYLRIQGKTHEIIFPQHCFQTRFVKSASRGFHSSSFTSLVEHQFTGVREKIPYLSERT